MRLRDRFSGAIVNVKVSSRQKGAEITGTKEVVFGRIDGKGKEYAFKIPTRFKRLS